MDLKETILQTIEEFEQDNIIEEFEKDNNQSCDKEFLKQIRERLLVLFDGLQSPNTENLEIKLDVTLNFLEYLLSKIDEKLKS